MQFSTKNWWFRRKRFTGLWELIQLLWTIPIRENFHFHHLPKLYFGFKFSIIDFCTLPCIGEYAPDCWFTMRRIYCLKLIIISTWSFSSPSIFSDVRLTSTSEPNSGVVEVYIPDQGWGVICNENDVWNFNIAASVCNYLNFPGISLPLSALDFDDNNNTNNEATLDSTLRKFSCLATTGQCVVFLFNPILNWAFWEQVFTWGVNLTPLPFRSRPRRGRSPRNFAWMSRHM